MSIKLIDIILIDNLQDYKIHLASWNKIDNPLDVFVRDKKEWEGWNTYRGNKDDFNRDYIFSLIDFYSEPDTWLFGGIYRALSRETKNYSDSYKIELDRTAQQFIGRLKVHFKRPGRAKSRLMERYYDQITVSEILKDCYTGEEFCGYENINYDFHLLESIFKANKPDWRGALINVKGVYLITDKSNGKRYVGSAYGDSGIWSRWACYMGTGHGWTDELTRLIKKEGMQYSRKNFSFALLEYRSMKTDDKTIIERENYWKELLQTRGPYGYNKN
ncbi:hypothetical protein MNBD_NITROSPINAE04-818 [hydrothermal vent metagenome]|uniref:GIY-YIG domain-containing protein n=1 Tax=hydrothermal vent metagenome TaxID=652676 RepID=A0A3B1BSF8_9ZZZZ